VEPLPLGTTELGSDLRVAVLLYREQVAIYPAFLYIAFDPGRVFFF
jgi:hypothetical protein